MSLVRQSLCIGSLALVLAFFLLSGATNDLSDTWQYLSSSSTPDFSKFVHTTHLTAEEFPIDDKNRRVVIVGDIHGMHDKLLELLSEVSYDSSSDVLVSVGDIIAKGPHSGSMAVLDFMTSNNIIAVRGNHDQKVIEWRSWFIWIHSMRGGKEWLEHTLKQWEKAQKEGEDDVEDWIAKKVKHDSTYRQWWKKIPKGWKFLGDHFKIAAEMTSAQYDYLVSLPLKLHIPHAHTFVVHAGLLASDPNYRPSNRRQPLAKIPKIPNHLYQSDSNTTLLRHLQEHAILHDVPQNIVPWNVLNMRGVKHKNHRITRRKEGQPWSKLYEKDMAKCVGFDAEHEHGLPCMPATVIYGHSASRGLDIKRWSIGLDTGCVYNRRLTALVLGGKDNPSSHSDTDDELFFSSSVFSEDNEIEDGFGQEEEEPDMFRPSKVRFGDRGWGRIVSIKC